VNTECRVSGVVAPGGNFWPGIKSVAVASHHLSSPDGKNTMSGGSILTLKRGGVFFHWLHCAEMVIFDPFWGGGYPVTYSNN
jgi:hypothetical protein